LAETGFSLVFDAPPIAERVLPGQFVHILCGEDKVLRRPISVCDIDGGLVKLVIELKGGGTEWLSTRKLGDTIDVLGPLGRGFPKMSAGQRVLLVGGGFGAAPLLLAANRLTESGCAVFAVLGFANSAKAMLLPEFGAVCAVSGGSAKVTTDDGSLGHTGFVTELMQSDFGATAANAIDAVFACGPRPMLNGVIRRSAELGVPAYVSLEERMACGIGTCLTCVCAANGGFSRVCRDGPVFEARELENEH